MKTNWQIKKLGEVCDFEGGSQPPKVEFIHEFRKGYIRFLQIRDFGSDKHTTYIPESKKNRICIENDVLLGRYGASVGKILTNKKGAYNVAIMKTLPKYDVLNKKYFYFYLVSDEFQKRLSKVAARSAQSGFSKDDIYNFPVLLPPLDEQKRIATILDEKFSAIEKAKENAEKNLKSSKELFDSYLESMLENKAETWEEKELKEITTALGDGLHGTPKYTSDGDYYFINGNNLRNGEITFKESTKRVNNGEFNKYKKNLNDRTILVSINGTLGNVAFYNGEKVILGKSACYFNLKDNIDKNFVKYVFSSRYFIQYAHREATGATIKNVSLKTMREFKMLIPSLEEQKLIVKKLNNLSMQTKSLEKAYQKKLNDLEELKKSILQKAFSGEL